MAKLVACVTCDCLARQETFYRDGRERERGGGIGKSSRNWIDCLDI